MIKKQVRPFSLSHGVFEPSPNEHSVLVSLISKMLVGQKETHRHTMFCFSFFLFDDLRSLYPTRGRSLMMTQE